MICGRCGDKGLFVVRYTDPADADTKDLAICDCVIGQRFRQRDSLQMLAVYYHLLADNVRLMEELCDPEEIQQAPAPKAFTDAGQLRRPPRGRL